MTIAHHPSEETLVDYVAGALDEGNSLVVAAHIARCPECQDALRELRIVAGAILETCGRETVSPGLRGACLASLDAVEPERVPHLHAGADQTAAPLATRLRDPLSLYRHGSWRRIGPGVRRCDIHVSADRGTRVFLLKADAGTHLPEHQHTGTEWTCVLSGAFRHDLGHFGPGDFDEADASIEHTPIVEPGEECVCLVALNGSIELTGWFGRLVQPFVRF
jgi:putative transcriptional regulator